MLEMDMMTGRMEDLVHGYDNVIATLPNVALRVNEMTRATEGMAQELEQRMKHLVDGYEYLDSISAQIPQSLRDTAALHKKTMLDVMGNDAAVVGDDNYQEHTKELDRLRSELQSISHERVVFDILTRQTMKDARSAKIQSNNGTASSMMMMRYDPIPIPAYISTYDPTSFGAGQGQSNDTEEKKSRRDSGVPLVGARAVAPGTLMIPSMRQWQGRLPAQVARIKTTPTTAVTQSNPRKRSISTAAGSSSSTGKHMKRLADSVLQQQSHFEKNIMSSVNKMVNEVVEFKKKAPTYSEKQDGDIKEKRSVQVQATFRPKLDPTLPRSKLVARLDKAVSTHHPAPWPSQHQTTSSPVPIPVVLSANRPPSSSSAATDNNGSTPGPHQPQVPQSQLPSERLVVVDRSVLDRYKVVPVSSSSSSNAKPPKTFGTDTATALSGHSDHINHVPSRKDTNNSNIIGGRVQRSLSLSPQRRPGPENKPPGKSSAILSSVEWPTAPTALHHPTYPLFAVPSSSSSSRSPVRDHHHNRSAVQPLAHSTGLATAVAGTSSVNDAGIPRESISASRPASSWAAMSSSKVVVVDPVTLQEQNGDDRRPSHKAASSLPQHANVPTTTHLEKEILGLLQTVVQSNSDVLKGNQALMMSFIEQQQQHQQQQAQGIPASTPAKESPRFGVVPRSMTSTPSPRMSLKDVVQAQTLAARAAASVPSPSATGENLTPAIAVAPPPIALAAIAAEGGELTTGHVTVPVSAGLQMSRKEEEIGSTTEQQHKTAIAAATSDMVVVPRTSFGRVFVDNNLLEQAQMQGRAGTTSGVVHHRTHLSEAQGSHHTQRYEGSRIASSAMRQRMGAAAEEGEHLLLQSVTADGPVSNGTSAAEMIATHLATALGALVQQTVLLANPQNANAHVQQQQGPPPVQRDTTQATTTPHLPVPAPTADSKKKVISIQNLEDEDDDDEGMEEVKADDDDDDDHDGKRMVQITTSQALTSSSGPTVPSEAVLTAVLRDVEASKRFMLSMRQFDLTSEASMSLSSSHSDSHHIHNPNQFSWSHLRHRSATGSRTEGNDERWHDDDDEEDNSSMDSYDAGNGATMRRPSDQPMQPIRRGQRSTERSQRQPTMLVSSVLACPSTRAVIDIGDEALLEGCTDDSNLDLGISAAISSSNSSSGTTLRRLHVPPKPSTTTNISSLPLPVSEDDQEEPKNETKDGTNVLPSTMKRPVSFTQLLDETNTTDDDLDDVDDASSEEDNAMQLAAPPPGIRLWTMAKKE